MPPRRSCGGQCNKTVIFVGGVGYCRSAIATGWRHMITVCEEVFLLMLDYDTGRPSTRLPDRSLRTALGGALLMDLALADRIDTDLDGLFVVDSAPLQEPVLDRALAQIAADGRHRPIDHWVEVFADDYHAILSMLVDRLVARGIVIRGRDGMLLVMGTHRYCDESGRPLRDARQRLAGELLSDEVPDPRDIMIVSLAEAPVARVCHQMLRLGLGRALAEPARRERMRAARAQDCADRQDGLDRAGGDAGHPPPAGGARAARPAAQARSLDRRFGRRRVTAGRARISHHGHGLRRAQAFDPLGAGRKAYRGIRLRPATPRAGAWARPKGRRSPADMVRRSTCPMSLHRAARLSCPVGRTAPRRP